MVSGMEVGGALVESACYVSSPDEGPCSFLVCEVW